MPSHPVLQTRISWLADLPTGLPGIRPASRDGWVAVDEAFSGQMAVRDDLLASQGAKVLALETQAKGAAGELLDMGLDWCGGHAGYQRLGDQIIRPDGQSVTVDPTDPLDTLGRLFQQDLCILQKSGDAHVLTGAVLCFPASWTLAEKIGRPLGAIHAPVLEFDDGIARRVQRLFDGVQPGRPLWRGNALFYDDPALYQPRPETTPHAPTANARFVRSERQVIFKLPRTGAVVFSIHTCVVDRTVLTQAEENKVLARH